MAGSANGPFRVTLLGTGAPPPVLDRMGPSALIEAGDQKFIVDAGRGAMQRLHQLQIPFADITGMFLTHHHSDHVVGFADLWLTGWIGRPWGKRSVPLKMWGPEGTCQMAEHLPLAFATDIRVRSGNYPAEGVKLEATEIIEGPVYEEGGLKVSVFEVDHGGEALVSFGYRFEYGGHSVVLSGDTTFNENVIRWSEGADVLIHEVSMASGKAAENPEMIQRIARNHTLPEQAGEVFARAKPRLAVYTHLLLFGSATPDDLIPATRPKYDGPLTVGADLMRIDIGDDLQITPFTAA